MFRLRKLYEEIRVRERSGQELRSIPLARFVLAILGLIGLEILLVLWLYELPHGSLYYQGGSGLLAPSILLTHPKGPLCLLLFLVAVAIATVCRDLADLTGNRPVEAQQKMVEMQRSLSQGYVLAGLAAAMTFLTLSAGESSSMVAPSSGLSSPGPYVRPPLVGTTAMGLAFLFLLTGAFVLCLATARPT